MDKGMLCIIAGVVAVLMIVVGVEVGIESAATTGIDLKSEYESPAEHRDAVISFSL